MFRDLLMKYSSSFRKLRICKGSPPWMHFHILSVQPAPVRKATLIRYSLRWRIFPIRWTTEIVEWDPPHRFVDVQLKGPYSCGVTNIDSLPMARGLLVSKSRRIWRPSSLIGRKWCIGSSDSDRL